MFGIGDIVDKCFDAVGLDGVGDWVGMAVNVVVACYTGVGWAAVAADVAECVAKNTDSAFLDNVALCAGIASSACGGYDAVGSLMDAGRFAELSDNVMAAKDAYDAAGAAKAIGDTADAAHQSAQMWQYAGDAVRMAGGYLQDFQRAQSQFEYARYRAQMSGI